MVCHTDAVNSNLVICSSENAWIKTGAVCVTCNQCFSVEVGVFQWKTVPNYILPYEAYTAEHQISADKEVCDNVGFFQQCKQPSPDIIQDVLVVKTQPDLNHHGVRSENTHESYFWSVQGVVVGWGIHKTPQTCLFFRPYYLLHETVSNEHWKLLQKLFTGVVIQERSGLISH